MCIRDRSDVINVSVFFVGLTVLACYILASAKEDTIFDVPIISDTFTKDPQTWISRFFINLVRYMLLCYVFERPSSGQRQMLDLTFLGYIFFMRHFSSLYISLGSCVVIRIRVHSRSLRARVFRHGGENVDKIREKNTTRWRDQCDRFSRCSECAKERERVYSRFLCVSVLVRDFVVGVYADVSDV